MSRRHLENLIFYVNELDDDVHCIVLGKEVLF